MAQIKIDTHTYKIPEWRVDDLKFTSGKILEEMLKPEGEKDIVKIAAWGSILADVVDRTLGAALKTETETYYSNEPQSEVQNG